MEKEKKMTDTLPKGGDASEALTALHGKKDDGRLQGQRPCPGLRPDIRRCGDTSRGHDRRRDHEGGERHPRRVRDGRPGRHRGGRVIRSHWQMMCHNADREDSGPVLEADSGMKRKKINNSKSNLQKKRKCLNE